MRLDDIEKIKYKDSISYNFESYKILKFQKCLSNELLNKLSSFDWVQNPLAWLHGQMFKYLFKKTPLLKNDFKNYVKSLKLDLTNPYVG